MNQVRRQEADLSWAYQQSVEVHSFGLAIRRERMKNDELRHVKHFEMEWWVPAGKQNKTWDEILRKNVESKGLDKPAAHNSAAWQAAIRLSGGKGFPL